jgi:hypothetical protein
MPSNAKRVSLVVVGIAVHAYLVAVLSTYVTVVRVALMPVYSAELDRVGMLVKTIPLSFQYPGHFLQIRETYMWYPEHLNGIIGAIAFYTYGLIAPLWRSNQGKHRAIAGIAVAICACVSLVFVSETPVYQWYELSIKLGFLLFLTGFGVMVSSLLQRICFCGDRSNAAT